MHDVATLALGFGFVLAAVVVLSIIGQATRHRRLALRLRAAARSELIAGRSVGIVLGPGIALVAGIRRPSTYLSGDLVSALTADELAAVIAHERHHELVRAPVRLIVLAGLAAPFGFVPPIKRYVERARARLEIEADSTALVEGSSRQAIASAIIKLSPERMAPPGFAPFASAAEIRLLALLDGEPDHPPRLRDDLLVGAAVAALVMLACTALAS